MDLFWMSCDMDKIGSVGQVIKGGAERSHTCCTHPLCNNSTTTIWIPAIDVPISEKGVLKGNYFILCGYVFRCRDEELESQLNTPHGSNWENMKEQKNE
jgi:hypothetical protein